MKRLIKKVLRQFGIDVVRYAPGSEFSAMPELTEEQRKILSTAMPYTMTGLDRMAALLNAVTYVHKYGITGDIAECGVWRGGSMMVVAMTLMALGDQSRFLYLYDTFEGMSAPTGDDKNMDGTAAEELLGREPQGTGIWCYAGLEEVRANLLSTGYPADKIHFVRGKVEDTLQHTVPSKLALLRLDTDWYESTKQELEHLYPVLDPSGVLIIDDYGHWQGAKKAVDEYFAQSSEKVFLHRIDTTGRILVRGGA